MQRGAGDVLHVLHHRDQRIVRLGRGLAGRETHAAVAHHHRGDAVVGRGHQQGIPGGLPVEVRVHVDPARRDQLAGGIDLAPPAPRDATDRGDASALHRDIARESRRARAVDDAAVADHQVVFHVPVPLVCVWVGIHGVGIHADWCLPECGGFGCAEALSG